jgi:RHS repeat-associated protein
MIHTIERKHSWGVDLSGTMQGAGGVGGLLQTTICTGTGGSTQTNNYPLYDGNGNVTDYVSQAGTTVASYKYDAFGNTHTSSGTLVNSFNYRFSTKVRDVETGLYYYGYRYYNTTTGKWINRDPIEETGGVNVYGFVGNDGVNTLDYLGNREVQFTATDTQTQVCTEVQILSWSGVSVSLNLGGIGVSSSWTWKAISKTCGDWLPMKILDYPLPEKCKWTSGIRLTGKGNYKTGSPSYSGTTRTVITQEDKEYARDGSCCGV